MESALLAGELVGKSSYCTPIILLLISMWEGVRPVGRGTGGQIWSFSSSNRRQQQQQATLEKLCKIVFVKEN
jgi:hypothetical protein